MRRVLHAVFYKKIIVPVPYKTQRPQALSQGPLLVQITRRLLLLLGGGLLLGCFFCNFLFSSFFLSSHFYFLR